MQSLSLALKAKTHEGEPLPDVFPALGKLGAHLRRGQLSLWAAAPGGGKSAVASEIVLKMRRADGSKPKVMYFSADSDKGTLGTRLVAGVTGMHLMDAEEALQDPQSPVWAQVESELDNVWFNWNSSPGFSDIEGELAAYCEVTGEYPDLIVFDNLKNLVPDSGGAAHEQYDEMMEWLKILAIETKSHVMVLHHVTGNWENGDEPIPLNGLLGKPGKACRLIMTLYMVQRDPDVLGMCIVKNSNGKADGSGRLRVSCPWDPSRSWFGAEGMRIL